MPCRCCGTKSRPSKGFKEPLDKEIHELISKAKDLILEQGRKYEYIEEWKHEWIKAFNHMLNGCDEKQE
jgi:hypothetical protein